MLSWASNTFWMDPLGSVEPGPICKFNSSRSMSGKDFKPGNVSGDTGTSVTLRLNAARNSFCQVGEKLWNSESESMYVLLGWETKKAGNTGNASIPVIRLYIQRPRSWSVLLML